MDCTKCEMLVKSRKQIVSGYGNKQADIAFIGLCPGNHLLRGGADETGIPFKGDRSGDLYEELLEFCGLTREEVYTTNLVKCRPAKPDQRYNRPPSYQEMENCYPYLEEELLKIDPETIIIFGRKVQRFLAERDGADFPFFFAYHPAYIARKPYLKKRWMARIRDHLQAFL